MSDVAPGRGVIRSPNIWDHPETYAVENAAVDRAGRIDAALLRLAPLDGADLLDVGCGDGWHLPGLTAYGARVVGLEAHGPLAAHARHRGPVVQASAERMPFADGSFDVVHARWAYFFGAGCEPGLAEVERVLRPGGVTVFVDHDPTASEFGGWFRQAYPAYDPVAVQRFWRRRGFEPEPVATSWEFDSRDDLEAVLRIEFPPAAADRIIAEHAGLTVDYAANVWWRRS